MKTFELTNNKGDSALSLISDTIHNACQSALHNLGYYVDPITDSDEVKDYHLFDLESGEQVSVFKTFYYENALTEALSVLGYTVYEL